MVILSIPSLLVRSPQLWKIDLSRVGKFCSVRQWFYGPRLTNQARIIEPWYERHAAMFVIIFSEHQHFTHYCTFRIFSETYQCKLLQTQPRHVLSKQPSIRWRLALAQLEILPDHNSRNRKARTSILYCGTTGSRCESILSKLMQRHCNKSSWMFIGEAFRLQHQGPKNHCQT